MAHNRYVQQLDFTGLLEDVGPNAGNSGSFTDPAFAANKTLPIHRWVPWIAGYSSRFVRDALERYLEGTGVLLDPFAGVGTTLVEGLLHGDDVIGFEINPYAALACRAKLNAGQVEPEYLIQQVARFEEFCAARTSTDYVPHSIPPPGFKTRGTFYSPAVLRKVLIAQDFIETLPEGAVRDLFRLAFASTMVRYSNYSYEPSLGQRTSAGKSPIQDFAVAQTIAEKLREIVHDIIRLRDCRPDHPLQGRVIDDTFFRYSDYLPSASIDLVITSPPYLNNYHYNRNTRPHLYWLGYAGKPQDFTELENANFGKYWQTVRELERVDLDFQLPGSDLAQKVDMLRGIKPERGIYGGNGWANYAASYFNDCRKFARGLQYALKQGGAALVVIGNSILQGVMIPTDRYFGEIAEAEGLELTQIHVPRAARVGNSIIQSDVRVEAAQADHKLYEAVVELRRQ